MTETVASRARLALSKLAAGAVPLRHHLLLVALDVLVLILARVVRGVGSPRESAMFTLVINRYDTQSARALALLGWPEYPLAVGLAEWPGLVEPGVLILHQVQAWLLAAGGGVHLRLGCLAGWGSHLSIT